MRLRSTDAELALQDEVRAFLANDRLTPADLPHALDERIEALRTWQAQCYLRRIIVREQQFGDAAHHERRLGQALAAPATAEVG